MNFKQYLTESKQMKFDEKKTDMPMYDSVLKRPNYTTSAFKEGKSVTVNYWKDYKGYDWKIVHITQGAYIRACAKGFNVPVSEVESTRKDLSRIKELVDKGTKIHMPVLDYGKYFNQEGIHRALYAKQLGMKSIPVLIFISDNRKRKLDDVLKDPQ